MKSFFLKRKVNKLKKTKPNTANLTFSEAKTIGLIFSSKASYEASKPFIQQLNEEGKTIKTLVQLKKMPKEIPNYGFFLKKDFNLLGKTNSESILNFWNQNFDFIFYFGHEFGNTLEFLIMNSKSRCSVGFYSEGKEYIFDFMVKYEDNKSLIQNELQVLDFIKRIKTNG